MEQPLSVFRPHRHAVAERVSKLSPEAARRDLLLNREAEQGFSILTTPAPPRDDTVFKVYADGRELMVAIGLLNSTPRGMHRFGQPSDESAEIFFDPYADRVGWFQFVINPDGTHTALSHMPYPEAHSSGFRHAKIKRLRTDFEQLSGSYSDFRARWVYAWFDQSDVFRGGDAAGFNVCRHRPDLGENSSWNYCGGYGFQDATGFGTLYLRPPPAALTDIEALLDGDTLRLRGKVHGPIRRRRPRALRLELASPLDERTEVPLVVRDEEWSGSVSLPHRLAGRYRLYLTAADGPTEPGLLMLDLPAAEAETRGFRVTVTDDPPMDLIAHHFTPQTLREEMEHLRRWGVDEVHWIEYGQWPSFWAYRSETQPMWGPHWPANAAACGRDFLATAVEQAHAAGLTILGCLKTFDLGYNGLANPRRLPGAAADLDLQPYGVIPEIAANPAWTLRANEAWHPEGASADRPATTLRVYSETPLPRVKLADIRLLVSRDNATYRPYRGRFGVAQGEARRPHYRWTPAGKVRERGGARNWWIELADLRLTEPYAVLQVRGGGVSAYHRPFMLVEALDAHGREIATTLAISGGGGTPLSFGKQWPGWNNVTDPVLQPRAWDLADLGIGLAQWPSMPALLEPCCEGSRRIWLDRVRAILDAGADGVDIRTYCHHNGVVSWLQYAFAPAVREAFARAHGRPPRNVPEDYALIRRVRGAAYTEFLRAAKSLCAARGRRFTMQFESGIEVPAELDGRMQISLDYEGLIREGVLDEINLKGFTAQSTWVHERVLPLARRHGIPVHVISPLWGALDHRGIEMAGTLARRARAAGFAGFNFYETANFIELNPLGCPTPKGQAPQALAAAAAAARGGTEPAAERAPSTPPAAATGDRRKPRTSSAASRRRPRKSTAR